MKKKTILISDIERTYTHRHDIHDIYYQGNNKSNPSTKSLLIKARIQRRSHILVIFQFNISKPS